MVTAITKKFDLSIEDLKRQKNIIKKETLEYFPTGAIITKSARGDIIDDEDM